MQINRLVVIGFFMVLIGAVLPFLIVLRVLESTFFLNFVAFTASTVGIFLGVIGTATYIAEKRRQEDGHNF